MCISTSIVKQIFCPMHWLSQQMESEDASKKYYPQLIILKMNWFVSEKKYALCFNIFPT